MSYLVIPAIFSLFIKSLLVVYNKDSLSKNYFTAVLFICVLHSCCEVAAFYGYSKGYNIELLFRTYYVLSIFWLTFAFIHSKTVAGIKKFSLPVIFIATCLSLLVLGSDTIISGYTEKGYSITAVKQEYYPLMATFLVFNLLGSILILSWQLFLKRSSIEKETQCFYLFIGFLTPFSVTIFVILSVYLGWNFSAIGVLPISNLLFFLFIVKSENYHHITDVKRFLPWSFESKASKQCNTILTKCIREEIGLKQANDEFQRLVIEYQKNKGYSKLASAKKLRLSKSTLYSKLQKLEINWRD